MTIDGVLSGLLTAGNSSAYALRAAAARLQPIQPTEPAPPASRQVADDDDDAGVFGASLFDVEDTVELSGLAPSDEAAPSRKGGEGDEPAAPAGATRRYDELSEEEQARVDELKTRDQEVRQHEQAHLAAAGSYARGGASYEYETGPDGNRYAVGGEVDIDVSPVPNDPQATIAKMQQVKAAALAPAEPSGADRSVAAQADAEIRKAQAEQAEQRGETQDSAEVGGVKQAGGPQHAEQSSAASEYDQTGRATGKRYDNKPAARPDGPMSHAAAAYGRGSQVDAPAERFDVFA